MNLLAHFYHLDMHLRLWRQEPCFILAHIDLSSTRITCARMGCRYC
mgnify:CR=1 FL=1